MTATRDFYLIELQGRRAGDFDFPATYGIMSRSICSLGLTTDILASEALFRLGDREYTSKSSDSIGIQAYRGFAREFLSVERRLPLDPHSETGVQASWGDLDLINGGGFWDEKVYEYAVDGRSVRILRGAQSFDAGRGIWTDPAYATMIELFRGTALGWLLSEDTLLVGIRDRSYYLDQPYQHDFYAGSGGYEGVDDLKGKPKPITRGKALNVTPVLIDPTNLIYQYNNGPGTITALYERGVQGFTYEGDTTDLYAGSTSAGKYRTDNSRGLFQLGASPAGEITADVTGEFPISGSKTNVVEICYYALHEDVGLSSSVIDQASFTTLAGSIDYTGGFYLGPELVDANAVITMIARSFGGVVGIDRASRFRAYRLEKPSGSPVASFDTTKIVDCRSVPLPETVFPPTYRWIVGWGRNHTLQSPDLDAAISDDRRQEIAQEWRSATWSDATVLETHIRATAPALLPTILDNDTDAQALADHLGALWGEIVEKTGAGAGTGRFLFEVTIPIEDPAWDLGDVIEVDYPLGRLDGGELVRVVRERLSVAERTVTLTVLA